MLGGAPLTLSPDAGFGRSTFNDLSEGESCRRWGVLSVRTKIAPVPPRVKVLLLETANNLEKPMRKRWLIGIILLLIVCGVAALTSPTAVLTSLGFLRREAFFAGKPTNYWTRAVKQEPFLGQLPPTSDIGKTLRDGGAAAVPVLCEMTEDPNEMVRTEALQA